MPANIYIQVLWPTLHYAVPDAPKTRLNLYDSKSFEAYTAVNRKFADAIVSGYHEGDISMSTFDVFPCKRVI